MDRVTQQNAALAEESAGASEELNAQAGQMKSTVDELGALIGKSGIHKSAPESFPSPDHQDEIIAEEAQAGHPDEDEDSDMIARPGDAMPSEASAAPDDSDFKDF